MAAAQPPALARIADFAAGLRIADLPPPVLAKARTCLLDVFWGCLHVHHDGRAQAALRTVPVHDAASRAHILTTRHRASAADAAYVNAIACAATDRSDTHMPTATHPGIVIIPAVLAALEERGGSGKDLLRGLVVGYEVMGRIGRAIVTPGFAGIYRTTAVTAPVAASVAVAAAMRLDRAAIITAGSLASHGCVGFNQWARAGTGEHVFHAGTAARNAVACAYLAAEGVEATSAALDGESGLLAGYRAQDRVAELTRDLGVTFEMDEVAFKPAPACFFAQTPAQVAARVAGERRTAGIVSIEIRVSRTAAEFPGCAAATGIATLQAAVMSIPFAVASTLIAGRIDPAAWPDFANPRITALAASCTVVADPVLTARYPSQSGAALSIRYEDGHRVDAEAADFRSLDHFGIVARYRVDAEASIGVDPAARLLALIETVETIEDAGSLAAACAVEQVGDLRSPSRCSGHSRRSEASR